MSEESPHHHHLDLVEGSDHESLLVETKKTLDPKKKKKKSGSVPTYRPDIDGIRTLAVSAVIVYHAYGESVLPGGYTGVDVFFVISGYLISSIILKQADKGTFTYTDFYSRRIRRIFPTLLLVSTLTLMAGGYILSSKKLITMSTTLAASTIFGANIQLLLKEEEYFDDGSQENPLLHLWSLGVEEQFYIVWPVVASLLVQTTKERAIWFLLITVFASFLLNITYAASNPKFAFYFPLGRFWQMAVGSLLAYYSVFMTPENLPKCFQVLMHSNLNKNLLSTVGLVLIIYCYISLDEDCVFPGWWATIPTLGCACLIAAGPTTSINSHLLSNRGMVFIGIVSYPMYLWHWPLLVFSRELYPNPIHRPIYAQPSMVIVFTFIFSIFTYYLLENKIRHNKSPLVVPILLALMVCLGITSCNVFIDVSHALDLLNTSTVDMENPIMVITGNIPQFRIPTKALLQRNQQVNINNRYGDCIDDLYTVVPRDSYFYDTFPEHIYIMNKGQSKTLLVEGDSHAFMILSRITKLYQDTIGKNETFPTVVVKSRNGCTFFPCVPRHFEQRIEYIKRVKPDVLLISFKVNTKCCLHEYTKTCELKEKDVMFQEFTDKLKELRQIKGMQIFIAAMTPMGSEYDPKRMFDANGIIGDAIKPISLAAFEEKHKADIVPYENAVKAANITLIRYSDNMCFDDVCPVVDPYGNQVMKDDNHLHPHFAEQYLTVIDPVVLAAKP